MLDFSPHALIILQLRLTVHGYTRTRGNGVEGAHSEKAPLRPSFPNR